MNLDKEIKKAYDAIDDKRNYARDKVKGYKKIENYIPSAEWLKALGAKCGIDMFNDLRIIMPWNVADRHRLLRRLDDLGWEIAEDKPREPSNSYWLTRFTKNNIQLELWMKADYTPPEGVESQCTIVKLGTKTVSFEQTVYDVVCPGDS